MSIRDHYIACGATHMRVPVEMPHHQTLHQYQQALQGEVERALRIHDRVVVVQVTTLFPSYEDLPSDAWNHGVIDTVRASVARRIAGQAKKGIGSATRSSPSTVRMAWGRFHRSDGSPGYQQQWILPLATFWALGQSGAASFKAWIAYIEEAWLGVCRKGKGTHSQLQLIPHDFFYVGRSNWPRPPLDRAIWHPKIAEFPCISGGGERVVESRFRISI